MILTLFRAEENDILEVEKIRILFYKLIEFNALCTICMVKIFIPTWFIVTFYNPTWRY